MTFPAVLWAIGVSVEAAALALGAARIRPAWRSPCVRLLAAALGIDLAIGQVDIGWGLAALSASRPRTLLTAAALLTARALAMVWPCSLAWAAECILARRRSGALPCLAWLWLGASVGMMATYPVSEQAAQRVIHVVELAALSVMLLSVYRGWRYKWNTASRVVLCLVCFESVIATVGPFASDAFRSWPIIGAGIYTVAMTCASVVLYRSPRERA